MESHLNGIAYFNRFRCSNDCPFRREADGVSAFEHSQWADGIECVGNTRECFVRPAQTKLDPGLCAMLQHIHAMSPPLEERFRLPQLHKAKAQVVHALGKALELRFGNSETTRANLGIQEMPQGS